MKVLFMSDLHIHAFKPFASIVDGENSRLIDICNSVKEGIKIADKYDCEMIVVAGDVFHTRGVLKPSTIAKAKEVFENVRQEVIMIAGNHDMELYRGGKTSLEVFKGMNNIITVESPQYLNYGAKGDILCLPYIHETKEFKRAYSGLLPMDCLFAVIHQGVDDFGKGLPATTLTAEYLVKDNEFDIFTGHYHSPEHYLFDKGQRVVQVGAICQHSFSDIGDERGVYVYDTSDKSCQFIPINVAPRFIEIDKWDDTTAEFIKGNFVRVRGKSESVKKIISKLADVPYSVKLDGEFTIAHESSISISSPVKMLSDYLDIRQDLSPFKAQIIDLYKELINV